MTYLYNLYTLLKDHFLHNKNAHQKNHKISLHYIRLFLYQDVVCYTALFALLISQSFYLLMLLMLYILL